MSLDSAAGQDPQQQLRVLAVTNLWPEGDSFRGIFVREQVEAQRRAGVHVDVEVVAQSQGKLDYVLSRRRVRQRFRSGRYDLIHVHYGLTTLATRGIRRVPQVLSLYGSDINVPWQHRITNLSLRAA